MDRFSHPTTAPTRAFRPTQIPRTPPANAGKETQPRKGVREFVHRDWTVTTSVQPILPEPRMEEIARRLRIEMPTMSFGNNSLTVRHRSGWQLRFTMLGALDGVDKTANKMLKVAHSDSWQKTRQKYAGEILEVVKPFDWSFTTDYKGDVGLHRPGVADEDVDETHEGKPSGAQYSIPGMVSVIESPNADAGESTIERGGSEKTDGSESANGDESTRAGEAVAQFELSEEPLPIDRLKQPDPILFFQEVSLFEDELADNGLAQLSVKIRVMPDRLFILQRFYLRLNQVLFRLRDTRICVEFSTGEVWREYTARESPYKDVTEHLMSTGSGLNSMLQATWNPDDLLKKNLLPQVEHVLEKVVVVSEAGA